MTDTQPCVWRREERGIAYEGWVGPVIDHWVCTHHGKMVRVHRGKEREVLPGYIELDDLHPEYRRPFWDFGYNW